MSEREQKYAEAIFGRKETGVPVIMLGGATYEESRQIADVMAVADAELAEARAEIERLRTRVHEIADEQQRRFAPYVSRCDRFDVTYKWATEYMPVDWGMTSGAIRTAFTGEREKREAAEAERDALRAQVRALVDDWDALLMPHSSDVDAPRRISRIYGKRQAAAELRAFLSSSEPVTAGPEDEVHVVSPGAFIETGPERWIFGEAAAAALLARVAWPNEQDEAQARWSGRLINEPNIRAATVHQARRRFESAIAALVEPAGEVTPPAEQRDDRCVCPDDYCLGIPGDSDECAACLALDDEADCLRDEPVTEICWHRSKYGNCGLDKGHAGNHSQLFDGSCTFDWTDDGDPVGWIAAARPTTEGSQ